MRLIDILECSTRDRTPKEAMRRALSISTMAFTAKVDGRPEAMFGIAPIDVLSGTASPWFLGTDAVYEHGREMLSMGLSYIGVASAYFPFMENEVYERNNKAIRLLKRWGFTVSDTPTIRAGVPMLRFHKGAARV